MTDRQTGRQRGTQKMKGSDYAKGTVDAGTKQSVHCLSTYSNNAFMQLTFSLRIFSFAQLLSSGDFKDFDCVALVQRKTPMKTVRHI